MDTRVAQTVDRIERELHTALTVRDLAAAVRLSPSRLGHLFRTEVGVSPAAYLHARRMTRARILLERTTLSVREVMQQVGLSDPTRFARDFGSLHGFSPGTRRQPLRIARRPGR